MYKTATDSQKTTTENFPDKSSKSSSTLTQIKKLYLQNGIKSLFTGLVPRVVKIAPACAIMISSYEYGKRFFANYNNLHYNSL